MNGFLGSLHALRINGKVNFVALALKVPSSKLGAFIFCDSTFNPSPWPNRQELEDRISYVFSRKVRFMSKRPASPERKLKNTQPFLSSRMRISATENVMIFRKLGFAEIPWHPASSISHIAKINEDKQRKT